MTSMHCTERPTNADALDAPNPTLEPTSRARFEGVLWSERMFAQARVASGDAARFAAGLIEG